MIERFFNYSLLIVMLMMLGVFVSASTFGVYTLTDAVWDTFGFTLSIAITDLIYQIVKKVLDRIPKP